MSNFNQYNTASKSLSENIVCALESIEKYGYQVVIVKQENDLHTNPMQRPSRELNDPFNWKSTSQFHRSEEEIKAAVERANTETEKDLILNWTPIFADRQAIEIYKHTGKVTKGLIKSMGVGTQVRTKDLVEYLQANGEEDRAKLFDPKNSFFNSAIWQPIQGVSYWEAIEGLTYAVYYNDNKEGLSKDELNEMLDNSVKAII